jgi:hypothetical protein
VVNIGCSVDHEISAFQEASPFFMVAMIHVVPLGHMKQKIVPICVLSIKENKYMNN